MTARQQWFVDRIGKRVYVAGWQCECIFCTSRKRDGEIIESKEDAEILFITESESLCDIRYFDTPEEVLELKQKQK